MTDLHPLVEGFPCPVLLISMKSDIISFNDAALTIFEGLEIGKPLAHATRNAKFLDAISKAIVKNEKVSVDFRQDKVYQRTINATIIPLQKEGAAASSKPGSGLLFVYMRDMSAHERLATMRMHFIANASHELRTPLAALIGFIETLQTSAKNDANARKKFLVIMDEQAQRMKRLISDLLSLSKIEMNDKPLSRERIDLVTLSANVVEGLQSLAKKNELDITTDLPDTEAFVRGEKDDLVQVLTNIVQNAIRYGGDGGRITVSIKKIEPSKRHPARFCLSVADNGRGIAKKHIPHLTERFYRVDKVISRNKGGTGLGLAIAKHIIEHHRGKLVIKSKQGHGSTFSVFLPAYVEA